VALKERGETPFGEAGEGIFLRFTNADLRELQEIYGKDFINTALETANSWDLAWMENCLRRGLKGHTDLEATLKVIDEEVSVGFTMDRVLNGLFISYFGKTLEEHIQDIKKFMDEELASGTVPPGGKPDSIFSTISGSALSGLGSTPKSSGDSAPAKSASSRSKRRRKV
jgi:hypothetical protein